MDIGFAATMVHTPRDISEASSAGISGASGLENIALPMVQLQIQKGFGKKLDLGVSGLYYAGNYIWGLNAKYVLYEPEEGFAWAFRLTYSNTKLDLSKFNLSIPLTVQGTDLGSTSFVVKTRTWTPELIASKRLDFAEPYVGAGLEYASGQLEVPVNLNVLTSAQTLTTPTYSSVGGLLFLGVSFRVPNAALRIALEEAYSTLGMHYFGLWFGLGF
jgi:hypothetical protein